VRGERGMRHSQLELDRPMANANAGEACAVNG
jgi:hypothetical protein